MSIANEINRINGDKTKIRNKLTELGLATSVANLDTCATAIAGIEDNGNISVEIQEGQTYKIPKGYHRGNGTVSAVSGAGKYQLQSKTATPTKMEQTLTPDDGYYGLSDVTISAIPNNYQDISETTATEADVLATKVFTRSDGVQSVGTMPNNGKVTRTIDGMVTTTATVPAGYTSGATITLTSSVEDALAEI